MDRTTPERVLDASPDGIVAFDADLRVTLVNAAAEHLLGRTDLVGTRIAEVLGGPVGEALATVLMGTLAELREWTLPGDEAPCVDVTLAPILGAEGGVIGGQAVMRPACRDVDTSRLDRLRDAHEQLVVTLRSIGEGVVVTDAEGRVTMMNGIAEAHTGWTLDEARGRPSHEVFVAFEEPERRSAPDPVAYVLTARRSRGLHDHTVLVARDGTEYPIARTAAPILMDDGRLIGAILVFRDMRARRKLEQELVRSARLEAIGTLAGGLAHDFNNLLTAILGSVSLALRRTSPADRVHALLRTAEAACLRAQGLTSELLTFSRGGAPVRDVIDLGAEIREVVASAGAGREDLVFEVDAAADLWPALVDAAQVRQALRNVLQNAIEASPAGGRIVVRARNERLAQAVSMPYRPGDFLRVDVVDQGPGIGADDIGRIFDPFFTTKPDATGLGLATAYSIVQSHGGFVTVESLVDAGTTFHLYLPGAEIAREEGLGRTEGPRRRRRVLLMDDDAFVRTTGQHLLEELGYEVEAVPDGEIAIERYRDALRTGPRYDLAIFDLTVPGGMGGAEALAEIRVVDPTVVAVVSSGYSDDPVMANYRDHGFQAVLSKPYGLDQVERKLREVLGE